LVVKFVGVVLDPRREIVRIERSLDDMEVFYKFKRNVLIANIERARSAVADGQQNPEDRPVPPANLRQFLCIDCQRDAYIARPKTVMILAVLRDRECAPWLLFVPAQGRNLSFLLARRRARGCNVNHADTEEQRESTTREMAKGMHAREAYSRLEFGLQPRWQL